MNYQQLLSKLNDEIAEKKKQEKDSMSKTTPLESQGDAGVLLPSAADMKSTKPKGKNSKDKDSKEAQEEWVQCDECSRWRTLPPPNDPLYPHDLPDHWTCSMNTWHPSKASCRF